MPLDRSAFKLVCMYVFEQAEIDNGEVVINKRKIDSKLDWWEKVKNCVSTNVLNFKTWSNNWLYFHSCVRQIFFYGKITKRSGLEFKKRDCQRYAIILHPTELGSRESRCWFNKFEKNDCFSDCHKHWRHFPVFPSYIKEEDSEGKNVWQVDRID